MLPKGTEWPWTAKGSPTWDRTRSANTIRRPARWSPKCLARPTGHRAAEVMPLLRVERVLQVTAAADQWWDFYPAVAVNPILQLERLERRKWRPSAPSIHRPRR